MTAVQAAIVLPRMREQGVGDSSRPAGAHMAGSIIGELTRLFPAANPAAIVDLVNAQFSRFSGAKVTTFVPILVVRACREALAAA